MDNLIRRKSIFVHSGATAFWLYGQDVFGQWVELAYLGDGVDNIPMRYMDAKHPSLKWFGSALELAEAYGFALVD